MRRGAEVLALALPGHDDREDAGTSVRALLPSGRIRLHLFERQAHLKKERAERAMDKAIESIENKGSQ